ncbi:hypothetical protein INR49_031720 [Caranx melampygus]|nr:hypothetical protein INR49_031720 [Caranx melampygus]
MCVLLSAFSKVTAAREVIQAEQTGAALKLSICSDGRSGLRRYEVVSSSSNTFISCQVEGWRATAALQEKTIKQ